MSSLSIVSRSGDALRAAEPNRAELSLVVRFDGDDDEDSGFAVLKEALLCVSPAVVAAASADCESGGSGGVGPPETSCDRRILSISD